jgi:hypothetical protein
MANNTLSHTPSTYGGRDVRPHHRRDQAAGPAGPGTHTERPARSARSRGGLAGLLALGGTFAAAAGTLGTRTWQVGSDLGAALFPVEDIVELAAVAVGTVVAGWVGLHALLALACIVAGRRGVRWAAGERAVAQHAPAIVRRLARAAAGAGLGLALAVPTAVAAPGQTGADGPEDRAAVVLDLGWQPTAHLTVDHDRIGGRAADGSVSSSSRPRPERLTLVDRGQRTGTGREPVVVVEPGDTLWAIAAGRLATERPGVEPSDAETARAVTRWHQANRQVLGGNPDLVRPGMVLRQP